MPRRLFLLPILALSAISADASAAPRYPVFRYRLEADAAWTREDGVLTDNAFVVDEVTLVPGGELPVWANLLARTFLTYWNTNQLGPDANVLSHAPAPFVETAAVPDEFSRFYLVRWPENELPAPPQSLVNVSTRATLSPGGSITVGFVVLEYPTRFLLRAVGPGLATYGVAHPVPNPQFTLFRGPDRVIGNDDWGRGRDNADALRGLRRKILETGLDHSEDPNDYWSADWLAPSPGGVTAIRNAENVSGAFPLAAGSLDAALVVILAPGAYTMSVASDEPGEVLAEAYQISD